MNIGLLENKMKVLERLVLQDIHDTYSMQKFSEKSYDELMPRLLDKVVNFYEALELDGVSLRKLNQYGERAEIYKKQLREDLDKAAMVTVRQLVKQLPREKLSGRTTWEVIQDVRPVLKQRMEGLSDLLSVSALQMENYMLLWDYQDLGFSHYCLLTEGENCDTCNSLAGQVFPISQACVGENFAPMHPNCNCRVGILDHKGQVAYVIGAENEEQKGEAKEKNWYDAFLRLPQYAKQLFLDFVRTQNERLNRGDMAGLLDWLTMGTVSGTGQGYRDRWQTLWQDPTLYNAVNYLSSGMSDTVKGAVQPAEALSLQHWLDSLGVVGTAFSAYQAGKAAGSMVKTGTNARQTAAELADDVGNSLGQKQKINIPDASQNTTPKIPWDSWRNYEKVTQNGKVYAKVGNRLYSKHAVDRMQPSGNRFGPNITQGYGKDYGRSIAPQYVEDVINSVQPSYQPYTGNYSYALGNVEVITNPQGAVITILTYKK